MLRKLTLVVVLLAAVVTTTAQQYEFPVTVYGRVLRSDGVTGIRAARLVFYPSTGVETVTYSNSFGYYQVTVLDGDYVVQTLARGYTFPGIGVNAYWSVEYDVQALPQ